LLGWGIRKRVLFVAVVPGAALAACLVFYFLQLRYEDVDAALVSRGAALARQLAPAAEYGAFAGNLTDLQHLAQATLREPDVVAVSIHDATGALLAEAGDGHFADNPAKLENGWTGRGKDGASLFFHAKIARQSFAFDDPFNGAAAPAAQLLGSVTLEMSRRNVIARKQEILAVTLLFTLALLAAATVIAYGLGRDITEPVLALEAVVRRIHKGELNARVQPHGAGTLRVLEDGVNEMAAELESALSRSQAALAVSEEELRQQNEFAQTLLQAQSDAGVGTLLIEAGRIVYANATASQIYGYSEAEMRALPSFLELVHPTARDQEWRDYQRRVAGEDMRNRYALPIVTGSGDDRIVEISVAAVPGPRVRRILCVVLDVTERKRDETLLACAFDELMEKKEEAERSSLAKSRFLAAASHDLRQPLHALTLFAAELENVVNKPSQRRLSHQISRAADAMGDLLEALLDISRLDIAGIEAQAQAFPLDAVLRRICDGHRESARAAGLRLVCPPTSLWVRSDPDMLQRMLGNLVANAIRYTPQGSILVGARRAGAEVRIEVRDSGIGIAAEHQSNIFEEFFQVANEERDAGKGLGLGLAIVDRLAKALGHRVTVSSSPGRGSTFSIHLPRALPAPLAASDDEPGWSEIVAAHVLVISINEPVCESLGALLRSWGCYVSEAHDADEITVAMEDELPDVIVCDDCCYAATRRQMELIDAAERPPLILIGQIAEDGSDRFAISGRLPKPVRPARLRALLRHLLEENAETTA
jgi:PAS domain S-box-containing protein